MLDKEIQEYRKLIGDTEFYKQYHRLYTQTQQDPNRYSGLKYSNTRERLQFLKEKYKNGVPKEEIDKMLDLNR